VFQGVQIVSLKSHEQKLSEAKRKRGSVEGKGSVGELPLMGNGQWARCTRSYSRFPPRMMIAPLHFRLYRSRKIQPLSGINTLKTDYLHKVVLYLHS